MANKRNFSDTYLLFLKNKFNLEFNGKGKNIQNRNKDNLSTIYDLLILVEVFQVNLSRTQ